ncbi:MAG: hypothetical protein DCC72_08580 [Burkholderiales bacterium]|nr:MAG: hypothetical protein DCC72_08580 [Burkholderiales bacterium]
MSSVVVLVWFRADPARNEECLRSLRALAARIEARFGVRGRFGWRDEPEKNRRTWLESWEPVDAGQESDFVEALGAEAASLGFGELAPGGRFVDVFHWADAAKDAPRCA